jgi:hypothetical protein
MCLGEYVAVDHGGFVGAKIATQQGPAQAPQDSKPARSYLQSHQGLASYLVSVCFFPFSVARKTNPVEAAQKFAHGKDVRT